MEDLERWEAFLAQIESRHQQVRQAAYGAAAGLFAAVSTPEDLVLISNVWSPASHRLQELENRIQDTWREKVSDLVRDAQLREEAWESGQDLQFSLENAREETEQGIYADLARHLLNRAPSGCTCQGCGAPIETPLCFIATELTCGRCGVQTVYEPGPLLRTVSVVGPHATAWQAAQLQWLIMRKAERRVRGTRSPCPLALIKDHERAQIDYWWTYIQSRGRMEPILARDPAKEVRARMDHWYALWAEGQEEWVKAGRPRETIG